VAVGDEAVVATPAWVQAAVTKANATAIGISRLGPDMWELNLFTNIVILLSYLILSPITGPAPGENLDTAQLDSIQSGAAAHRVQQRSDDNPATLQTLTFSSPVS
jgi:hypothetical protein